MIRLGLTGHPVEHSLSPKLHAAALSAGGLQGEYSLYPILRDDRHGLAALLQRLRNREIHGLNVTIPHKRNVIEFLDELTPAARLIGAVNTIYLRGGKLIGDNTDAPGFLTNLNSFLTASSTPRRRPPVTGCSSLVLGAGGSARAVVYGLLHNNWRVNLAARRPEQARELAKVFASYELRITDFSLSNLDLSAIDLIVNTTPIGMVPNPDASPWPAGIPFPVNAAVYDLVYTPRETLLVRQARAAGLAATTGLGMLAEQAALAFQLWTGHNPSRKIMLDAVSQETLSRISVKSAD
jgi:shikimate dehydrogenase